ncbi:hypothetical protein L1987_64426 [Smallanthus sonchifolius]|uniref:Uncharacterized protein n=1 Tax=Smallanthus sonchifolius TaxID=185202 RepID=A0ACB9CG03_9ASTR|nr:hypothetical protein L1987_64426 [Smallanthus sonchifolius]
MKTISKVPLEPAPWKQRDGARAMTSSTKIRGPIPNVYSEVDKRLKNLEFAESGKNLRALKQILDAMQTVEARKDERQETMDISSDHDHQNPPCVRGHESHIVLMKPRKLVKKGFSNDKTGKDRITESTRVERQSRPSMPLTDSSKPRKHSNKQRSESRSQSGNRKPSRFHKIDDKNSEYSEESNSRQSSSSTPETNREKLKKVENLVQKLKNLNSSHNESHTDYIASLCENTNPNDRYISEICLASGLLFRDLKSFNLYPSGHPINPELFLVLEHTKFRNQHKEKFHRKLIFDAVNEILVGKLSSGSGMIMQDPRKLLRELCLEIEQLQARKKIDVCELGNEDGGDDLKSILWEDVLKKSETWTGFYGENLVIAMEVERLILMDLVKDVVMVTVGFNLLV